MKFITLDDFKRLIRPLTNKVYLTLARAVLKAVNNSEDTQKLQILALANETITDLERFQEYGFETYPFKEAEAFVGFLNGNRQLGVVLVTHDRRHRPKDLAEGEVAVYTDEDNLTNRHRIHFKRGQEIETLAKILNIIAATSITETTPLKTINGDVQINGKITVTGDVKSTAGNIEATLGDIDAPGGDLSDQIGSISGIRTVYNTHDHDENDNAPNPTDEPNQLMT